MSPAHTATILHALLKQLAGSSKTACIAIPTIAAELAFSVQAQLWDQIGLDLCKK